MEVMTLDFGYHMTLNPLKQIKTHQNVVVSRYKAILNYVLSFVSNYNFSCEDILYYYSYALLYCLSLCLYTSLHLWVPTGGAIL